MKQHEKERLKKHLEQVSEKLDQEDLKDLDDDPYYLIGYLRLDGGE